MSSLLIHGASGGIGSITFQIAKEHGIHVLATASESNQEYLESLGAEPVPCGSGLIDRLEEIHPDLFDALVDMIGNEKATQASLARQGQKACSVLLAVVPFLRHRFRPSG